MNFYSPFSSADFNEKKAVRLGAYPKGQFCKNTVYLERDMPYFAFASTKAVLRMP